MKTIESRKDIKLLVDTFYIKIRKEETLGPIFNKHIPETNWPEHLEKLTDFWETNLFGIPKFKGNPTLKHVNVDKGLHHKVDQVHFGLWLQLWFETIDELYTGDLAIKAKEASRRMAHGQFMAIWNQRPKTQQ
ncbi:group III truncated hemoglobin [Flavicella sp.]|uniref:group III truncated hemoglobin n=1 Tax=Flavicella sp. TaxID=2957742 RepID=UPI00262A02C2|nr:group III truncated hemoglobin [Flavicella sp.]MDG1806131.1 group III truncated hemoglobin [Flavicella sp.]